VPPDLIQGEDGVGAASDGGVDFGEMGIHRIGGTPRQDEADGLAPGRINGA